MRESTAKSIGIGGEPKLRKILNECSNMSASEQKRLKNAIIENLKLPTNEEEKVKIKQKRVL